MCVCMFIIFTIIFIFVLFFYYIKIHTHTHTYEHNNIRPGISDAFNSLVISLMFCIVFIQCSSTYEYIASHNNSIRATVRVLFFVILHHHHHTTIVTIYVCLCTGIRMQRHIKYPYFIFFEVLLRNPLYNNNKNVTFCIRDKSHRVLCKYSLYASF